jgi:flagellar protein FliO/FliZ
MKFERLFVITLAVGATLLTGGLSSAAEPPPPAAEAAPAREAAPASAESLSSSLPVRPSKPLSLEPAPPAGTSSAGKIMLFVVLLAGGIWVWTKRAKKAPLDSSAEMRVLRRTTIGVRSELLLVELEGQKLLIGVTPSSMQTLYLLPDSLPEEPISEPASERRIATLLEARIAPRDEPRIAPRDESRDLGKPRKAAVPTPATSHDDDSMFEGQAASLRSLGSRR